MSAPLQMKRKLSSPCDWKVKPYAYTVYVVPIAVNSSKTWLSSRSNLLGFENFQHLATKLIFNSNQSYRHCLVTLKLLPLSLYVKIHDISSLIRGDYGVDIDNIEEAGEITRQTERCGYRTTETRINKTTKSLFRRTKLLLNYVSRDANDFEKTLNKINEENLRNFFHKSLSEREQVLMENDKQMWKLQHTKENKVDLNCELGGNPRVLL